MGWIRALEDDDLPEGSRRVLKVGQHPILVIRHKRQLYAIENVCPHMRRHLSDGWITEDNAIVCPWHRSAFDLKTGEIKDWSPWPPVVGPMLGAIRRKNALPVYPVKVEDGLIWIFMDENEKGAKDA